jgi:hypothetical protein
MAPPRGHTPPTYTSTRPKPHKLTQGEMHKADPSMHSMRPCAHKPLKTAQAKCAEINRSCRNHVQYVPTRVPTCVLAP